MSIRAKQPLSTTSIPQLTTLELIGCIADLAGSFQADVIVDDIGAFGEPYFLQWNDPFAGSANDYDLGLADAAGNIVATSVGWQDGDDDPLGIVFFHNPDAAAVRV